jgi:hypothetical protein
LREQDYIGVLIVNRDAKSIYLRPVGYATQENSLGIPDFLEGMFRQGCVRVAIDLSDCLAMDSTFLGVIADAATNLPRHAGKPVLILNAAQRDIKEFRTVGLLQLVKVVEHPVQVPDEVEFMKADFIHFPSSERERIERIKYLHEQLVKLNERNKKVYGSFVSMLQDELEETDSNQHAAPNR